MGCFNVACSISNISIGHGQDTVFIPLIPPGYGREKIDHMIIYPNDLFNPFCLPIRGKYNDYGSLEEIIKDENTEVIEKFLGITVEELMKCISRKGVYDQFSMVSKLFFKEFEVLSKYATKVGEDLLRRFGFVRLATETTDDDFIITYECADTILPYFLTISQKEINIITTDGESKYRVVLDEHHKMDMYTFDNVLAAFASISNYYVGVPREKQDVVKLIISMSGMFIAGEIYDTLTEKRYLETYGSTYEEALDNFISEYEKVRKLEAKEARMCERMVDYRLTEYHRNWQYFKEMYKEPIIEGKLRDALITYNIFAGNMYSMNRFFFPGMNGEQHGNHKASLVLAEKTVEILKAKIKDYEEDYFEDEEE